MAGSVTFWLPAGIALVALLSFAAGWNLRKRKESQHEQAVEASAKEFILAAGRARDRARAELEELEARYQALRSGQALPTEPEANGDERPTVAEAPEPPAGATPAAPAVISKPAEPAARTQRPQPSTPRKVARFVKTESGKGSRRSPDAPATTGRRRTKRAPVGPAFVLSKPDGPKDDLKAIRGIGPGLERALNTLGVFHYSQLAGLTDAEVDWLGQRLGAFPGRIRKDGWPEQARRLFAASPAKAAKPARRKRAARRKPANVIRA